MRKINSDLFKLAEKFLIQLELENNEIDSRKYLLNQSVGRNLEKLFNKNFNITLEYLSEIKKDSDYYFETYTVWTSYWNFYARKMNYYKMQGTINNVNNFFIYFLLASLKIFLWGTSYFRVVGRKNDLLMYEEVLNYIEKNLDSLSRIPQIIIIYSLIMLVTKKEEQYFIKLKELKKHHFDCLSDIDKENLFIMMVNYCHDMILTGQTKFRKERFEVDKEYFSFIKKLKKKIHIFGILSSIKNANRLKEFKWVEEIIREFECYSGEDNKVFGENYVYADICFFKKKYDEALEHLSKIKTPYSNQKQYVKNLMLQIYFENSSYESALSLIDTSKHFLKTDKHISENTKLNSLNFIKLTEKLISVKQNKIEDDFIFLGKNILKTQELFNKEWLLEKIEER